MFDFDFGDCGANLLQHTQIVVLDKLDYCASLHNLREAANKPNFKVRCRLPEFKMCNRDSAHKATTITWLAQFVKGDIQSADLVRHVFDQEEIDTVMHFAAQVCCCCPQLYMQEYKQVSVTPIYAICRLMWTTRLAIVWPSQ